MKQVAVKKGLPNLRKIRQDKKLSLGMLSDLSKVRRDLISKLESGQENPEPHHSRMLARALGVSPSDL